LHRDGTGLSSDEKQGEHEPQACRGSRPFTESKKAARTPQQHEDAARNANGKPKKPKRNITIRVDRNPKEKELKYS